MLLPLSALGEVPKGFAYGLQIWNFIDGVSDRGGWGACSNTQLGGQIAGSQIGDDLYISFYQGDFSNDGRLQVFARIETGARKIIKERFLELRSGSESRVEFELDGHVRAFKLGYERLAGPGYNDCFMNRDR